MKAIIQCYTPQECERIARGEQTVKVCKTAPNEAPFKVYIYQTKESKRRFLDHRFNSFFAGKSHYKDMGKVIGEFICDRIVEMRYEFCDHPEIGYPVGYDCGDNWWEWYDDEDDEIELCMSDEELNKYACGLEILYGLHISELKIYDEPKELSEFFVIDKEAIKKCEFRSRVWQNPDFIEGGMILGGCVCDESEDWCTNCKIKPITRPPQSWCYVEEN